MCGIAGIRRFDGQPVSEGLLRRMTAQLTHRGPDDEGFWVDRDIGFGHRRLSIIDLGTSRQPMPSNDGRLHVCFNGEIFNYRALMSTLKYDFRTKGDTETLLAAYDEHGSDSVLLLEGQFAYAIYDSLAAELWLYRDRLGVLPLYYYHDQEVFAFASEIKALIPALPNQPSIDEASIESYLSNRAVPAPHTMFKGISKLPPGHRLLISKRGTTKPEQYWSIPRAIANSDLKAREAVDRVNIELERSVRAALVSDVPVGAYLSGGVDSSLIVSMMSKLQDSHQVETYAAGFGDVRHDELPFARRVSEILGTSHHEVVLGPDDFLSLWPTMTWHRDAPISEPSDIAVHCLSAAASDTVKVVLSGEGSDELFAGYPKYSAAHWLQMADLAPQEMLRRSANYIERRLPLSASRLRVPLRVLSSPRDERDHSWFASFTKAELDVLAPNLPRRQHRHTGWDDGDAIRRMLEIDVTTYLPDNLLERDDRMSMAASVELRPPFLNHRMVELAFSLPSNYKLHRGQRKWIIKEVARRHLPNDIVDRKKIGFRVPLDVWLRGSLRTMAWDMLTARSSFVSQLLDRDAIKTLLVRHDSGVSNEEIRLWTLLSLEVWHTVFFGSTNQVKGFAVDGRLS